MIVKCIGTCRRAKISKTQTGTMSSDHLGQEEPGKMKAAPTLTTVVTETQVTGINVIEPS